MYTPKKSKQKYKNLTGNDARETFKETVTTSENTKTDETKRDPTERLKKKKNSKRKIADKFDITTGGNK